jgi:hypothetical protein
VTRTVINGRKVALRDTPGFNDTLRSDKEVLESVSQFLGPEVLLSGLIYSQPVSINRVQGSQIKFLWLFKHICGQVAFSKVIIVSTMWSEMKHPKQARISIKERENEIAEIAIRVAGMAKDKNEIRTSRVVQYPLLNLTLLINLQVTFSKTCAWLSLGVAAASCAMAAAPLFCATM